MYFQTKPNEGENMAMIETDQGFLDFFKQVNKSTYGSMVVPTPKRLSFKDCSGALKTRWHLYCACGKEGTPVSAFEPRAEAGEMTCGTEMSESLIDRVYSSFWKYFMKEDMEGFVKEASELTGRKLTFDDVNNTSLGHNPFSLMLFYTMSKCNVRMNYTDLMNQVYQSGWSSRELENENEFRLPICLNDDHLLCPNTSGDLSGFTSRLLRKGERQEFLLSKLFADLTKYNRETADKKCIFDKFIRTYIEFVAKLQLNFSKNVRSLPVTKVRTCKIPDARRIPGQKTHEICALSNCEACRLKDKFMFVLSEYNSLVREKSAVVVEEPKSIVEAEKPPIPQKEKVPKKVRKEMKKRKKVSDVLLSPPFSPSPKKRLTDAHELYDAMSEMMNTFSDEGSEQDFQ